MPEIRSLTGLRFWAAFSILLHHFLLGLVPRGTQFETMLMALGSLGMTAFFVLSGFIIHYNYHLKVAEFSRRSYFEFLVARVSRLFPLFIFLLFLDILTSPPPFGWKGTLNAMPYFLTMSQSWFYMKGPGGGLLPFVFPRASISWSISTEMLMYCAYPAILAVLVRDRGSDRRTIVWVISAIAAFSVLLAWLNNNRDVIDWLAMQVFGKRAAPIGSYPFSVWFTFYSPYVRIFEFLIGALVAHLFLARRGSEVTCTERYAVNLLVVAALAVIGGTFIPKPHQPAILANIYLATGYFPWVAALIYGCSRLEGSWVDSFFSLSPFVKFGEWSYSLYLFHIFVYHAFVSKGFLQDSMIARLILAVVLVFLGAYLLYTVIEMPCRKRMRAWLLGWTIGLDTKRKSSG